MGNKIAAQAHTKIRDFRDLHSVHISRACTSSTRLSSDTELVRALAAGDALAEKRLVSRYNKIAVRLLNRLTANRALRDDLYQEAFMAILIRLRNNALRDPAKLSGYISRTIRFTFYQHVRDQARAPVGCESLESIAADTGPTPERLLHVTQLQMAIRDSIGHLRQARDRELLCSLYLDEEDKLAIATRLALTPRHFDRVSFRGRCRLAQQMRRSHPEFTPEV